MFAATTLVAFPATADPDWRLDLSGRGVGSVELTGTEQMREGFVPAASMRALRRVGALDVGGTITAGFPAFYGRAEAAFSVDHEHVLARPTCVHVSDGSDAIGHEVCRGARWSIAGGLDAGVGLLYAGAPPETPASSDALIYWGPVARARLQLHVLDVLPSSRAVGLVVGANAAITSARYTSTASGTGVRFEPELEVGLTMRL
jgi:hypothetical protein